MMRSWPAGGCGGGGGGARVEKRLPGNTSGPEMLAPSCCTWIRGSGFLPGTRIRGTDGRISDPILGGGGNDPRWLSSLLLSGDVALEILCCCCDCDCDDGTGMDDAERGGGVGCGVAWWAAASSIWMLRAISALLAGPQRSGSSDDAAAAGGGRGTLGSSAALRYTWMAYESGLALLLLLLLLPPPLLRCGRGTGDCVLDRTEQGVGLRLGLAPRSGVPRLLLFLLLVRGM